MSEKLLKENHDLSVLQALICEFVLSNIVKFKRGLNKISSNSLLQADLRLSSLEMISLITDLCDKFEIDITTISDVDLAKMKQVVDIANILATKKIK